MPVQRPFEMLNAEEISRLMELAIEAGLRTDNLSPVVLRACGALAAQLGFELWFRDQARLKVRRECGRSFRDGHSLR
jgi:hypothetical protein